MPSLLDDASALVIGYAGSDFEPAPYPEAVVGVVAQMVKRVLLQGGGTPPGVESYSHQAGAFMLQNRFTAGAGDGGPWLSRNDKLALRPYRRGGGMTSVQLVGERYNITESSES